MVLDASGPGGVGTRRRNKYVVLLQSPGLLGPGATHFAFVIASTDKGDYDYRAYDVQLGPADGFDHATIVDGRWVLTYPRARLDRAEYCFTLSDERMEEIADAIVAGLQLWSDS